MPLYRHSDVSVESFVELSERATLRYELDKLNEQVTIVCGSHDEYVMTMHRNHLSQLVNIGRRALSELDATAA